MTSKMTQRDKKLLSGLAFFGIIAVFLLLVLLPICSANKDMKDQISANEERIAQMEQKEMDLPAVRAENESKKSDLAQIQEHMFPMMKSQEIDELLTEKVMAHRLSARKLQITMPEEAANVSGYGREADDGSNPDKKDGVWLALVNMDLSGAVADMDALIDDLAADTPGVRITNLNFSSRDQNTALGAEHVDLLSLSMEVIMSRKE